MTYVTTLLPNFRIDKLDGITFGQLEGEKDNLLSEAFYHTHSIKTISSGKYNYILSPKGGGKSALFKAIKDNFVTISEESNNSKCSIISINEAFGFDNNYLELDKFLPEDHRKNYSLAWAVYLLVEIIKDIQSNHKGKIGYDVLISDIKNVTLLKEEFKLYSLSDFVDYLNVGLNFTVNGQQFDINPKIKIEKESTKLNLNKIFKSLDNFYLNNKIQSRILIDRLDNFVNREEQSIQKNYIQGLIDCIEELSNLNNIHIQLFIRTDLFYTFDIDFEYDKIKDRTINLSWKINEIFNFIIYRLLTNEYIQDNFGDYFLTTISENIKGNYRQKKFIKYILYRIFSSTKWRKENIQDFKREYSGYNISDKFIYLFFPRYIESSGTDIITWISLYLSDANFFLNPRLLIYFFNELLKDQARYNLEIGETQALRVRLIDDYYQFPIFSQEIFSGVYKKIQNNELINIFKLLKNKKFQATFLEINKKFLKTGLFSYSEVNKIIEIPQEFFYELTKKLELLGYCQEKTGSKSTPTYEIPKLYLIEMKIKLV